MSEVQCPHCGGPVQVQGRYYLCRNGAESGGRRCYPDWGNLRDEREAAADIAAYLRELAK